MKTSDFNKLDNQTLDVVNDLIYLGYKPREIGVYTMYANVHITIPSSMGIITFKRLANILPDGSSVNTGNNFRSGFTIRLPWNFPAENYEKKWTHFD
jgi:hypothetical protein